MTQSLLKEKARILRSQGASLDEIVSRLDAPKSTIRYWCRDIMLSNQQLRHLFKKQKWAGIKAAEKMRQQRIQLTKRLLREGSEEIGKLFSRELFLIGVALYWAEGYRKGDGEFGFTNTDPRMIQFILYWLKHACGIEEERIHLRICINAMHSKRIRAIEQYWIRITGMNQGQFSKPTLIHVDTKKHYLNSDDYFGTLRIKVKNSTNLRRKIIGWIEGLAISVKKPV